MSTKTTVELIQEVNGQIESTIESCSSEKKRSKIEKSLGDLKTSLSQVLAHLHANEQRKYIQVRKGLKAVHNLVDGALEGVSSKELTPRDFRGILSTLQTRFYPMVCSSLSSEIEKAERQSAKPLSDAQEAARQEIAESADIDDALKVVQKAVKEAEHVNPSDHELTGDDLATIKQLRDLAAMRSNLPIRVKTDFQMVRMPVIPIFSNYQMNSAETFAKLGIRHVLVEGYAILLNQVIIAVSEKRAASSGLKPKDLAEAAVAVINERSTIEYEFVSPDSHKNPRNADIHLFWLMPRQKMAALMRIALTGRKASTLQWNFPL